MDEEYSSTPKFYNFSRTWLSFSNNIYFAFFLKKNLIKKKRRGESNRCHESFNDDSFNDGGDSFFVNVIDSILVSIFEN